MNSEYPKMLYRVGSYDDHMIHDGPVKIGNEFANETRVVDSREAEEAAKAEGWKTVPHHKATLQKANAA